MMAQSCFRIGSFDAVVIQYSIFAMPMPMPITGTSLCRATHHWVDHWEIVTSAGSPYTTLVAPLHLDVPHVTPGRSEGIEGSPSGGQAIRNKTISAHRVRTVEIGGGLSFTMRRANRTGVNRLFSRLRDIKIDIDGTSKQQAPCLPQTYARAFGPVALRLSQASV